MTEGRFWRRLLSQSSSPAPGRAEFRARPTALAPPSRSFVAVSPRSPPGLVRSLDARLDELSDLFRQTTEIEEFGLFRCNALRQQFTGICVQRFGDVAERVQQEILPALLDVAQR